MFTEILVERGENGPFPVFFPLAQLTTQAVFVRRPGTCFRIALTLIWEDVVNTSESSFLQILLE